LAWRKEDLVLIVAFKVKVVTVGIFPHGNAMNQTLAFQHQLHIMSSCQAGYAMQSPSHDAALEMLSSVYDRRRMPIFLSNVAPDAEVHSGFLDILDSFQRSEDGTEVLADTVKELTGLPSQAPSTDSSSLPILQGDCCPVTDEFGHVLSVNDIATVFW
jgi:hypothetical protein